MEKWDKKWPVLVELLDGDGVKLVMWGECQFPFACRVLINAHTGEDSVAGRR